MQDYVLEGKYIEEGPQEHLEGHPLTNLAFGKDEGDKIRFLADYEINAATTLNETISMEGLQGVINMLRVAGQQWEGKDIELFKEDQKSAFMQWALHPRDRKYLCVRLAHPQRGHAYVFRPVAMGMGARASPQQYARIPHAMCHILRNLAGLPVLHHLDDFIGVEIAGHRASSAQRVVQEFHAILGIKLNAAKSSPHGNLIETLGIDLYLPPAATRSSSALLMVFTLLCSFLSFLFIV